MYILSIINAHTSMVKTNWMEYCSVTTIIAILIYPSQLLCIYMQIDVEISVIKFTVVIKAIMLSQILLEILSKISR